MLKRQVVGALIRAASIMLWVSAALLLGEVVILLLLTILFLNKTL
jgi:hypothetical protein